MDSFNNVDINSFMPFLDFMALRKILYIVMAALICAIPTKAQNEAQFSDFTRLKSFYNPAVSGTDGMLNVAAAYAMQYVGYDNAPKTLYVGADMPIYFINSHHGAGLSLFSDDFGIFKQQKIALQYAYNTNIGKKTKLAVGAQFGIINEKIDAGGLLMEDNNDPVFPSSEVNGTKVDVGAGIYVYNPKYWAGASVTHVTAPLIELNEKYEYQIDRMYYLMGGYNIRLKNTFLTLQPAVMVMTDLDNWREDIQCKLKYEYEGKSMFIGAGYSPDISATVFIGGNFHGISLCYSYQMYTSGIDMINGSHELSIGYQTELDLFKKGRNRHKSARFL